MSTPEQREPLMLATMEFGGDQWVLWREVAKLLQNVPPAVQPADQATDEAWERHRP